MADMDVSPMVPQVGDTSVSVPVTLDYSGGRSQSTRTRVLWTGVSLFILIFVEVGILLSSNTLLTRLLLMVFLGYGSILALRFLLMQESKHRREMRKRIRTDYSINMSDFWSIYEIVDEYCYFLSGHVGMFVMLEKGAIVGKNEHDEFDNYEAITDAYTILGTSKLKVCHIDIMDMVGRDDRIRRAHRNINKYEQTGMKDVLEEIYRHLQKSAETEVTSYDIYLFMYRGDEGEFESNVKRVLSCLMDANYSSYTVLTRPRIQTTAAALFNLHDFSVSQATKEAFRKKKSANRSLTPINLAHADGTITHLNKTTEEKKQESTAKQKQDRYRREEIARRSADIKSKKKQERLELIAKTVSSVSKNKFTLPVGGTEVVRDGTIDLDSTPGEDLSTGDFFDIDSNSSSDVDDFFEIDLDAPSEPAEAPAARVSPTVISDKSRDEGGSTGFFDIDD